MKRQLFRSNQIFGYIASIACFLAYLFNMILYVSVFISYTCCSMCPARTMENEPSAWKPDKNQPVTQSSMKKRVANKRSMMQEINRFWTNSPGAYGGKLASGFGMLSAAQLQHMEHVYIWHPLQLCYLFQHDIKFQPICALHFTHVFGFYISTCRVCTNNGNGKKMGPK